MPKCLTPSMCCLCLNNSAVKTAAVILTRNAETPQLEDPLLSFQGLLLYREASLQKREIGLLPLGLRCCAGILNACKETCGQSPVLGDGACFQQLSLRASTLLFSEGVNRWSCDLWKVSHCLLMCCMLTIRVYTPGFLCPRNLAGMEFG